MALLRYKDALKLSEKELANQKLELEKEQMRLNSQVASGTAPENPGRIKEIRRTLARIKMIENQKGGSKSRHD